MATSSRKTALTALSEVTENEGFSNIVIDKAIRAAELSPRDAALASTIFYGVLEKRLTLDGAMETEDCVRALLEALLAGPDEPSLSSPIPEGTGLVMIISDAGFRRRERSRFVRGRISARAV